jgi:hypothetical protein
MNDRPWKNLRKLLLGLKLSRSECNRELAQAAMKGGVLRLAVERDVRLAQWVQEELDRLVFQDLLLERAGLEIESTLAHLKDELLLLKGSATAHTLYEDSGYRERRDIDLLATGRTFDIALKELLEAEWQRLPDPDKPWWAKRAEGRYEETLFKEFGANRVEIDLHKRLSLYRHFKIDDGELLARSTRMDGIFFRIPSPVDIALHTALHGATTGFKVPLKSWFDLHLLTQRQAFDWDTLCARSQQWGIASVLWSGLLVLSNLFATSIPAHVAQSLKPSPPVAGALTRILAGLGEGPVHSGSLSSAWRQMAKALALGGGKPWDLVIEHARLRLDKVE